MENSIQNPEIKSRIEIELENAIIELNIQNKTCLSYLEVSKLNLQTQDNTIKELREKTFFLEKEKNESFEKHSDTQNKYDKLLDEVWLNFIIIIIIF